MANPKFLFIPGPVQTTGGYPTSVLISTSTYQVAVLFNAPRTGSIDKIMFRTLTIGTGCTLDVRLETISDGTPTGTLISTGSNASQVVIPTDDYKEFIVTLTASASVTAGVLYCIRFNVSSGAPATFGIAVVLSGSGIPPHPYRVIRSTNSGSSWSNISNSPIGALRYSDAVWEVPAYEMCLITDKPNTSYDNTSTPNTYGNYFTLDHNMDVMGYWGMADLDDGFEISIYDSSGIVAGSTFTGDGNYPYSTSTTAYSFFVNEFTLLADTPYVLAMKATGSSTVTIYGQRMDESANYTSIDSAFKSNDFLPWGFQYASAKDPSDISDFTTSDYIWANIGLIIDATSVANPTTPSEASSIFFG